MGYYDNVKDSIKEQDRGENSAKGGNFDTLKENAEENTSPDEEKGDDTPIEVVDDGISRETPGRSSSQETSTGNSQSEDDNPFTSEPESSADMSGLEDKLDKIIEQNERMIEILESFGS